MKKRTRNQIIESLIASVILIAIACYSIPRFIETLNINTPRYFPDPYFKRIAEHYMEIEPGGKFTRFDAAQKEIHIKVDDPNAKTVRGIEFFKNVWHFECRLTQCKSIDLSKNLELKQLQMMGANLSELILPHTEKLTALTVYASPLGRLDLASVPNLEHLKCFHIGLSSLDVSMLPNLKLLDCSDNQIETITVQPGNQIKHLICQNNRLTELDLARFPNVRELMCWNNPLRGLDLSISRNLQTVSVSYSQITDLSACVDLPNLKFLSVYFTEGKAFEDYCNSDVFKTLKERFELFIPPTDCYNHIFTRK